MKSWKLKSVTSYKRQGVYFCIQISKFEFQISNVIIKTPASILVYKYIILWITKT